MKIKEATEQEQRSMVDFGRYDGDEATFSRSGKAILLEHPAAGHSEDVWVPVSLCRLYNTRNFGQCLCVPYWWCHENLYGY